MKTLSECLDDRPVSPEVYEVWTAEGVCLGRRYKGELKPELTDGLNVAGQRDFGQSGSYVMRIQ